MNSLRAKLTFASIGLLLTFVWGLAFFTSTIIEPQMESIQKDRQFEMVQYLAADLDQDMKGRVSTLSKLAGDIDAARMTDTGYLKQFLEGRFRTESQFDGGLVVIGMDGRMRAEWPVVPGRKELSYADRDNFKQAIATHRPYIGKPSIGLSLKRPVLVVSVPVIDAAGTVRAVVSGVSDLTARGLLGSILEAKGKGLGSSEIFLLSLRDNLIIVAPDTKRVLTATPAPGQSEIYDRFRAGFEGSAVGTNSLGETKLYSGKRLTTADWLVEIAIPTEIAFKPIRVLLSTLYGAAVAATLLALLFIGWLTGRLLAPLARAGARLDAMSSGQVRLERLPEEGEEEVRQLLASFNRLSSQLQQQQTELQLSEATYRSLFDNMLNGFAYCRMIFYNGVPSDFIYLNVNTAFETLTGLKGIIGKKITEVIPGIRESDPQLFELYGRVATSGKPERFETFVKALDQWFLLSVYGPQPGHFVAVFDVITERKRAEQELRLAAITFDVQEGIVITDRNNKILRVNQAFTELTGYSAEEVIGKTPSIFKSGRHDSKFYEEMWTTLLRDKYWQGEIWDRRKNGEIYPKWSTLSIVTGPDGQTSNYIATFSDITLRKEAEEKIHLLAFYDPLTQLPNRRLLQDRLNHALAGSARLNGYGAVLFIDLDNFKTLNDTKGHDIGDLLLIEVASRLQNSVRTDDTVARIGGDEFVVVLEGLSDEAAHAAAQAEIVGEKIRDAIKRSCSLNRYEHHTSASIGITLFHGHDETVDELFKHADAAMYQSKRAGRNTIRFFDPVLQAALENHIELESELRQALPNQQLKLYYQIQVDNRHRPLGAEVLLRWQNPSRGLVSPVEFIPLAEETGLIVPIGTWVLESACAQLKVWEGNACTRDLQLAVNVSARQFRQSNFVEEVRSILLQSAIDPAKLKLELTESMVLDNIDDTIAKMKTLQLLGVSFSIDDFGTGQSSLSYLKRLPISQFKIDRSFVSDICTDPNDAIIVQTIIGMANNLGLNVIAEGVETEAQLEFLKKHACHAYQGYLFGKPVPLQEFEALLASV